MTQQQPSPLLYRIGAVSKLTGIPVTTLRVWETRYGAFTPQKSSGRHRLYEEKDVLRAQLFKQLTADGHAISTLASLDLVQLGALRNEWRTTHMSRVQQRLDAQTVTMAVVGLGLAGRIESTKFTLKFSSHAIKVSDVYADLAELAEKPLSAGPHILLISVQVLDDASMGLVQAAVAQDPQLQVIVIYSYGMEATLALWRAQGWVVRREPMSDEDLAELICSVLIVDAARSMDESGSGRLIPARKYDDAILAKVAGMSTSVLCACPQHVAELILQLASFEAYCHSCLSRNANDAHLHAFLASVSGSARALFERALEKVAEHEGIKLDKA